MEDPTGELPVAEEWAFDIGTDWGNRQLEYDIDGGEDVSLVGNGNLAITAREESRLPSLAVNKWLQWAPLQDATAPTAPGATGSRCT